eukprot:586660-Lingulodinium_polyedra.AAC.1
MAHPGRMPEVGLQAPPRTPSMRSRRSAWYAATQGPATHSGTPALRRVGPTLASGMWSKALRQSRATPAMASPAASAASSSTASSHASSAADRLGLPPPHSASQAAMSLARPALQAR